MSGLWFTFYDCAQLTLQHILVFVLISVGFYTAALIKEF